MRAILTGRALKTHVAALCVERWESALWSGWVSWNKLHGPSGLAATAAAARGRQAVLVARWESSEGSIILGGGGKCERDTMLDT